MNGLLLAAGLGTRFKPYTSELAKPAIPLLNVPLAYYNMHLIQQVGLEKLVVNTHHLAETVKKIFSPPLLTGTDIYFSDEVNEILGTGGAVKFARSKIEGRGTFVMTNTDVVAAFGLRDVLNFHHEQQPMATMVVMQHPEAGKKYGAVWVNEKHEVVSIGKTKPSVTCKPMHFVGVHFIEESVFKYIPDGPCDINKDVYMKAIETGEKVLAYEKNGIWLDCGNVEDYLHATEQILKLLPKLQHQPFFLSFFRRFWENFDRRPNLWEGENCEHLLELGASHLTLMGDGCKIHGSTQISGFAVFGNNCRIEKNVTLKNVVVGPNVIVRANQTLSNTLLL